MAKCDICNLLLRELCYIEKDPDICNLYEKYELEEIENDDFIINTALKKAGFEAYQKAKDSLKDKGLFPKNLPANRENKG